jgi:hypothetical protein
MPRLFYNIPRPSTLYSRDTNNSINARNVGNTSFRRDVKRVAGTAAQADVPPGTSTAVAGTLTLTTARPRQQLGTPRNANCDKNIGHSRGKRNFMGSNSPGKLATESVATLPPFSPIEEQKWFDQISSQ